MCLVWLALLSAASAQAACEAAAYRDFDFWVGDWDVRTPDGKVIGSNKIEREYGGCVIHERWVTPRGFNGESLNIYDAQRQLWHQTWVDTSGTLLLLEGRLVDGKMVLEGLASGAATVRHRISWTPNADGSVRQLWESTNAQGQWSTAFDGRYTRR